MDESMLEVRKEGNVSVLEFKDKMTYAKLDAIKEELNSKFSFEEMMRIIVDISEVKILDSAGIGLIVSLYKSAIKGGGKFVILSSNNGITDILKTVGLNRIVTVHTDMKEALKSF